MLICTIEAAAHGITLPPLQQTGYHEVEIGPNHFTVAVAPARCTTISDIAAGQRVWGLAAQIYGLRSTGDCGIGDMAGAVALGRAAANMKADVLALSPVHALFGADPNHFSPYSPSSRVFYNPLHADATSILGEAWVAKARSEATDEADWESDGELIDWPRSSRQKMAMFRRLFDRFFQEDFSTGVPTPLSDDFAQFRAAQGSALAEQRYSKSCIPPACEPAAPDLIPPPLINQLKAGGRMVIPVGLPNAQRLVVADKDMNGRVRTKEIMQVLFSLLEGSDEPVFRAS